MEKVRYMISDAANLVNVETHVLRYWEDELELAIPRNEMGHRYYTRENIQEFQRIKELKEQGYQLKAIRMLLHNGNVEEFQELAQQSSQAATQQPSQAAAQQSPRAAMQQPSQAVMPPHAQSQRGTGPVRAQTGQDPSVTPPPVLQPPQQPYTQAPVQQPLIQTPAAQPPSQQPAMPQQKGEPLSPEERMSQFRELMSDIVGHAIAANNEELSLTIGQEVQERVLKEMNYLMREQEEAQEERYKKLDAAIRGSLHRKRSLFRKAEKSEGKKAPDPAGEAI